MFEKFTARSPQPRKAPVEPLKAVPETAGTKVPEADAAKAAAKGSDSRSVSRPADQARPKEIDGPSGPEPTRYGDWERKGICVDF